LLTKEQTQQKSIYFKSTDGKNFPGNLPSRCYLSCHSGRKNNLIVNIKSTVRIHDIFYNCKTRSDGINLSQIIRKSQDNIYPTTIKAKTSEHKSKHEMKLKTNTAI